MPENYSDTPLLLHLKLREIEINSCNVIKVTIWHFTSFLLHCVFFSRYQHIIKFLQLLCIHQYRYRIQRIRLFVRIV